MATIAELLEAANRKVQRGEETKALLKTRLTEKGLDVASEDNFYNLADKVGEISAGAEIKTYKFSEVGNNTVTIPFLVNNCFFVLDLSYSYSPNITVCGVCANGANYAITTVFGNNMAGIIDMKQEDGKTIFDGMNYGTTLFFDGDYTLYYW